MAKLNLEGTGLYEVRTENKGTRAVQAAREFRPDLIFLDVMMPDLSGDEISTIIKNDDDLKGIKLVFLTAIVTRNETADGRNEIGGNQFLAKPVKLKDLLYAIDQQLNIN